MGERPTPRKKRSVAIYTRLLPRYHFFDVYIPLYFIVYILEGEKNIAPIRIIYFSKKW